MFAYVARPVVLPRSCLGCGLDVVGANWNKMWTLWLSLFVSALKLAIVVSLGPADLESTGHGDLNATSAQRLAVSVDAVLTMAKASEQLAGTSQSLRDDVDPVLEKPLVSLGLLNEELRKLLQRLRDELGALFTSGESAGMRPLLAELAGLQAAQDKRLQDALAQVPGWTNTCGAAGTAARYQHFKVLRDELRVVDSDLRRLNTEVYEVRALRADADGALAGLEQRLKQQRSRRPGEEYILARYLGSSLVHWDLLRTKVAHHLATTFTAAREEALAGMSGYDLKAAETRLAALEEELQRVATVHKDLTERRLALGKKTRAFLKSMLVSCEAASGDAPLEAVVSKRFQIVRSKRLGVAVQALEELARFLTGAMEHGVSQLVEFLQEVLAPYVVLGGELLLPKSWKAKPKIGRWWEWLDDRSATEITAKGVEIPSAPPPIDRDEFERRFGIAKRKFSVHISASQPAVMAYLMWLLLEEVLGATAHPGMEEVLALPSPMDHMANAEPDLLDT